MYQKGPVSLLTLSILETVTATCQNADFTTCNAQAQSSSLQGLGCYHPGFSSPTTNPTWSPPQQQPSEATSNTWGRQVCARYQEDRDQPAEGKKLAILRYWYHALVPDEKSPGKLRHVREMRLLRAIRYVSTLNVGYHGVLWNLNST